jgi:hypothetical protein
MERIALLRSGVLQHLRRRLFQPNAYAPTILRNELDASLFQDRFQMIDCRFSEVFASLETDKRIGRNIRTFGTFDNSPFKSSAGHTKLNC